MLADLDRSIPSTLLYQLRFNFHKPAKFSDPMAPTMAELHQEVDPVLAKNGWGPSRATFYAAVQRVIEVKSVHRSVFSVLFFTVYYFFDEGGTWN